MPQQRETVDKNDIFAPGTDMNYIALARWAVNHNDQRQRIPFIMTVGG